MNIRAAFARIEKLVLAFVSLRLGLASMASGLSFDYKTPQSAIDRKWSSLKDMIGHP
jgi:hypothetical protein